MLTCVELNQANKNCSVFSSKKNRSQLYLEVQLLWLWERLRILALRWGKRSSRKSRRPRACHGKWPTKKNKTISFNILSYFFEDILLWSLYNYIFFTFNCIDWKIYRLIVQLLNFKYNIIVQKKVKVKKKGKFSLKSVVPFRFGLRRVRAVRFWVRTHTPWSEVWRSNDLKNSNIFFNYSFIILG